MFTAWTTLLVRWVKVKLEQDAEEQSTIDANTVGDFDSVMLTSNFVTLTMDLAFRCNYLATI